MNLIFANGAPKWCHKRFEDLLMVLKLQHMVSMLRLADIPLSIWTVPLGKLHMQRDVMQGCRNLEGVNVNMKVTCTFF